MRELLTEINTNTQVFIFSARKKGKLYTTFTPRSVRRPSKAGIPEV